MEKIFIGLVFIGGIFAASQTLPAYFDKHSDKLTMPENVSVELERQAEFFLHWSKNEKSILIQQEEDQT